MSNKVTAEFKCKIETSCEGKPLIVVPKITLRHVKDRGWIGLLAPAAVERFLDLRDTRNVILPNEKIECIRGGLISTFRVIVP